VGTHREGAKTVEHPAVGPVALACDTLTDGDTEHKIVIMTAASGTADETNLRLAAVAGTPTASPAPSG
jgi:transcription regulator MmyB-like protein